MVPTRGVFDKTILNMKKDYAENLKQNGYWLSHMIDFFFDGRDFQTDYEKTLNYPLQTATEDRSGAPQAGQPHRGDYTSR